MLTELSILDFASQLASEQPTPGGGSAAALCGLTGVCLLEMVINLSIGQEDLKQHRDFLLGKQSDLTRIHIELQLLIDRDAQAFGGVMAAYQMPKESETEKQLRRDAIQSGFRQAAEIPLDTSRFCLEALEIAKSLCGKVNHHAVSDLAVGALSIHAGAVGALLNTAINLPALNDKTFAKGLDGQVHLLRASVDELLDEIRSTIYSDPMFSALRPS